MVSQGLKDKHYTVVETATGQDQLFYVDVFVFQYPADYPTVTLTIRTASGTHYIDRENIRLFGNREAANLKIARQVAERIPAEIDVSRIYDITLPHLVSGGRVSVIGLVSNAATKGYRSNYAVGITWPEDSAPEFIAPGDLGAYLSYCLNFQGIRYDVKDQKITVALKINQRGRFEILEINSPIALSEKQQQRIHDAVNAFPLWIVQGEMDRIDLLLGTQ